MIASVVAPMALDELWAIQANQQRLWHNLDQLTVEERAALSKDFLLHLHEELAELQRLTDKSRFHILKPTDTTSGSVVEEGVDVFKMLMAVLQLHGVTAEQFAEEFMRKSAVVKAKWEWQQADMEGLDVLLCDIDGVLADYTTAFRRFCDVNGIKVEDGGVNRPELESLKEDFSSHGCFALLEPIPGALATIAAWRNGMQGRRPGKRRVVLVTARPYRRHPRLYHDTLSWCLSQGLAFDHILFEPDKAEAVRRVQPAHIVAMIEDRAKHALEVAATGVRVFKLPCEAEETVTHPLITVVSDWGQISNLLISGDSPRVASRGDR